MNSYEIILEEDCVMVKLNHDILSHCKKFVCGNDDLDEFFNEDALHYDTELLGKTYCWLLKDRPETILHLGKCTLLPFALTVPQSATTHLMDFHH